MDDTPVVVEEAETVIDSVDASIVTSNTVSVVPTDANT